MSQNTIGPQVPLQRLTDNILSVNEKILMIKETLSIPSSDGSEVKSSTDKIDFLNDVSLKMMDNLDDILKTLSKI